MFKQMCWLPGMGTNGLKILHLRTAPNQPWRPYTAFSEYVVPDYPIPNGSQGWSTYQKLSTQGWNLVSSTQEMQSSQGDQLKSA